MNSKKFFQGYNLLTWCKIVLSILSDIFLTNWSAKRLIWGETITFCQLLCLPTVNIQIIFCFFKWQDNTIEIFNLQVKNAKMLSRSIKVNWEEEKVHYTYALYFPNCPETVLVSLCVCINICSQNVTFTNHKLLEHYQSLQLFYFLGRF